MTPPLTGSQALDLADLADIASNLLGRRIRRQVLGDDDLPAKMALRGATPRATNIVLGLYRASRKGEFATVDPTLEQLLGRRPISMKDLIAEKIGS